MTRFGVMKHLKLLEHARRAVTRRRGRSDSAQVSPMLARWGDDVKAEGRSRVTWEIDPVGDSCRLTVVPDQLREGANDQLYGGWPMILSGLKTWLETGELLTTPGSLMSS